MERLRRIQRYLATFSIFLISVTAIVYEECGLVAIDANTSDVRCCKPCDPGYGVIQKCSNNTDTVCARCPQGHFSPNAPHSEPCKPCKTCGKYDTLESTCTETQDTVCKCSFNFYLSPDTNNCELCRLCPIASGAKVRCSWHANSECEECQDGTFSDVVSPISPCKPCTVCKPRQFMLQNCTKEQDTICLDFKVGLTDYPRTRSQNKNIPNEADDKDSFDVIPIYCAILGAVVAGLLGYVIYKHYTRLRKKRHHKVHDPHEDIEYSKASGGDSGVFVETDIHSRTYNQLTKVRDLPLTKRKSLTHMLAFKRHSGDDWKALAEEFGYTCEKIDSFEADTTYPEQNAQRLINHWSKGKHATVGLLLKALSNIGRLDVVRILLSDMQNPKTDHKVVHVV